MILVGKEVVMPQGILPNKAAQFGFKISNVRVDFIVGFYDELRWNITIVIQPPNASMISDLDSKNAIHYPLFLDSKAKKTMTVKEYREKLLAEYTDWPFMGQLFSLIS